MSDKDKDSDVKTPETQTTTTTVDLRSPEMQDRLVRDLFTSIKEGNADNARRMIELVVNINYQDPVTGSTALHYAAAYSAKSWLVALINSGRCDYLIRDAKGRYPSEVADELGDDLRIAGILAKKEARQAHRTGVQAWPKPPLDKA
jgi:hypothetical protein